MAVILETHRRGFFGQLLVLGAAAVSARLVRRKILHANGVTDDSVALQAWVERKPVFWADGSPVGPDINGRSFFLGKTVDLRRAPKGGETKSIINCSFKSSPGVGCFIWA